MPVQFLKMKKTFLTLSAITSVANAQGNSGDSGRRALVLPDPGIMEGDSQLVKCDKIINSILRFVGNMNDIAAEACAEEKKDISSANHNSSACFQQETITKTPVNVTVSAGFTEQLAGFGGFGGFGGGGGGNQDKKTLLKGSVTLTAPLGKQRVVVELAPLQSPDKKHYVDLIDAILDPEKPLVSRITKGCTTAFTDEIGDFGED